MAIGLENSTTMLSGKSTSTRTALGLVVIVVAAAAASACGGSSGNASASSRDSSGLKFSECMRSHGVSNFPDPSSGGGIQIPQGVNPRSPAFQSAQNACQKLLPFGGPSRHASEQDRLRMFAMSRCMRAHGVTDFPDPINTPPNGPPPGGGLAFGVPGSFLVIPQSLIHSPAFTRAAGVCGLPGAGRPPKGAKVTPVRIS